MKTSRIKLFAITLFVLPMIAMVMFSSQPLGTLVSAQDDEATTTYKAKCAMCHSPKAEKLFDPAKTDDALVETVMKGRKGDKPPFMPSFETKGMTAEQAKALVAHMKVLRTPAS